MQKKKKNVSVIAIYFDLKNCMTTCNYLYTVTFKCINRFKKLRKKTLLLHTSLLSKCNFFYIQFNFMLLLSLKTIHFNTDCLRATFFFGAGGGGGGHTSKSLRWAHHRRRRNFSRQPDSFTSVSHSTKNTRGIITHKGAETCFQSGISYFVFVSWRH